MLDSRKTGDIVVMVIVLAQHLSPLTTPSRHHLPILFPLPSFPLGSSSPVRFPSFPQAVRRFASVRVRRSLKAAVAPMMSAGNQVVHDVIVMGVGTVVALGLLRFWEEMAKRGVFQQVTNRKLVHISIGLAFMLFWPLFSSEAQAPFLAATVPAINIIRMLVLGLGLSKNEAVVKSMSRSGDHRELLKGPLYYACTITVATILFWRTSPTGFATVCNLCAGDGVADIIGRRFGGEKLPYNKNKSFAGTIAMVLASFSASIIYMHYFSLFGLVEESSSVIMGLLLVSVVAAMVESLPISTKLDDNLTVPLVSVLIGYFVF